eukprot:scaffold57_cov96-Isochrysis_galbana.AAC.2
MRPGRQYCYNSIGGVSARSCRVLATPSAAGWLAACYRLATFSGTPVARVVVAFFLRPRATPAKRAPTYPAACSRACGCCGGLLNGGNGLYGRVRQIRG